MLDRKPDFKAIENKWSNWWFKQKIYGFDARSKARIYSIDYSATNYFWGFAYRSCT